MLEWTTGRILALLEASASEGSTLEFKAELPARSDKGRSELLKDVSAFANASGGTLIYGVAERNGAASSLSGLAIENPDEEARRLSQTIQSGIEPRLSGLRTTIIFLESGDVLVLDIPQSFDGPHRYHFNGHSKFVQRTGSHTVELSFDQLRAAFDRSGQRLERLRADWAMASSLSNTWKPLARGPVAILRVGSLLSAENRQIIDPKNASNNWSELILDGWGGGSPIYNYEGLAVAPSRNDAELAAYTQVHRTGAITSYKLVGREWDGKDLFFAGAAEKFFLEAGEKAFRFLTNQGIAGSAVLYAGVTRLTGHHLASKDRYGFPSMVPSTRDTLQLPELLIDDIGQPGELASLMRPGFDLIWQAFGHGGCPNFAADGSWSLDNT